MKTYKLIQTYPGSFPLGHLAVLDESVKFYNLGTTTRSLDYIENHPEYWLHVCHKCHENIKTCEKFGCKKDYEILSFITKGYISIIYVKNKEGRFSNSVEYTTWTEKELLSKVVFNIHSVKRLSDGEIFTIGDPIGNNEGSKLLDIKIKGFDIDSEYFVLTTSGRIKLSNVEHRKKPLFTTEDGVEIFEGDTVYYVFNELTPPENAGFTKKWKICNTLVKDVIINNDSLYYKVFAKVKAAENYIKMNKPCLSLQEITELWYELYNESMKVSYKGYYNELTKIVKQKLK